MSELAVVLQSVVRGIPHRTSVKTHDVGSVQRLSMQFDGALIF